MTRAQNNNLLDRIMVAENDLTTTSAQPSKAKKRVEAHEQEKYAREKGQAASSNSSGLFASPKLAAPAQSKHEALIAKGNSLSLALWKEVEKALIEGHLENLEKLLKSNPKIVYARGDITDYSKRTFKNISPFQLAAWAYDMEMCELILKYMDPKVAAQDLNALEKTPKDYSPYGAHFDFTPWIEKTKHYLYMRYDYDKCKKYWQKEVGGAQRMLPAHVIWRFCEKGENVSWVKKDPTMPFTRQYQEAHVTWWFAHSYNGGNGVGSKWASMRAWCDRGTMWSITDIAHLAHDHAAAQSLFSTLKERLSALRSQLEHVETEPTLARP